MAQKKIPMRMCVGCRQMRPKKELLRVVRSPEGEVGLDNRGGKSPGRGAYLCPNEECFARAVKTRALDRALDHKVEEDVIAKLRAGVFGE